MPVDNTRTLGRFAAALCMVLLPQCALSNAAQNEPPNGMTADQAYNPGFAALPTLAPAVGDLWAAIPAWGSQAAAPAYRSLADASAYENAASPSFDIGGYDAMWDDTKFSEISAYGGLGRDAVRVAGMRAIDGSAGASGPIPYGLLTVQRDFLDGQHQLALGAYGTQVSVRQTSVTGFGDDSYTDVAVDGTWRWMAHPERAVSDAISAHVLVLREDENLIASHAIFGTRKTDDLTVLRGDASWSWGANVVPVVQYFRVTGSADPVRLGTLDGSPNSNGFIAEMEYLPPVSSPLNRFNVRLSLQYVAYSEFDGSSRNVSQNNTVLLHLSANLNPDS